jgi:hypothetical protein
MLVITWIPFVLRSKNLCLGKWDEEWDERLKAHIQRIAEQIGCTWWDVVKENRNLFLDEVDDILD